ncbi:hypothetical protein QUF80_03305 [Desulfococcaceae bacterium HSG8]|nr:hypothetical protein [Desulfococcaceae bacterium HSG8]
MACKEDPLLAELRQIKAKLWDESGHDVHRLAEIMEREARKAMNRIGKHPTFLTQITSPDAESAYREALPHAHPGATWAARPQAH